jgi:hypothetical protein
MSRDVKSKYWDDYDFEYKKAIIKNERLIQDLEDFRKNMLGLGTNKIKRRLNKLSKNNTIAKAIRLALEIEDKNISAKKYRGYDKYYESKYKLILELIDLFNQENWIYGKQKSDGIDTDYIIYFEIPGCEQISWHVNFDDPDSILDYNKNWDGKINSTLYKIADSIKRLELL